MPYRRILESLLALVEGARTALLLDAQGEVVVGAGDLGERQRLIGAYQGIALGMASRTAERFEAGDVRSLVWRHDGGTVVLMVLKDGYYLVLSLGPESTPAAALRHCEDACGRLQVEIQLGLRDRLRGGLARTREVLTTPIEDLVRGRRPLDADALEAVEEALLAADMGPAAVAQAMEMLRARSGQIVTGGVEAMREALGEEIRRSLDRPSGPPPFSARPWVVFVVGVNGAGKTTTIGKLAAGWTAEGRSVLLCAADTFRAAAAEQLEVWAARAGAAFHRGAEGADPSAVLTDALRSARARGTDAVLVDTAGRLHTKSNLMAELAKMARTAGREVDGAPHETLLVLDATVGSNGLAQGREFAKAGGVTGLVLTKLDGTAKGGVAVAVVRELGVPIRYVGVGEKVEDLLPFDAAAFAASLVGAGP